MTIPQMALGLSLRDDKAFSNFFVGKNKQLLVTLHTTANGRGERQIYFWGPKGAGRTHLLQACCAAADKLGLTTLYLPLDQIDELQPDILSDLESLHLVCIDDIQNIAGKMDWEEAFFHFLNRMREARKRVIISGNASSHELGITLPDVVSRLSWGMVFQLHELSDEDKLEALQFRAKARGLILSHEVARFLFRRWPRDMASLFGVLEQLDQASLAEQRRLTIPFVKSVLEI